jgi:hypothetical protein
VKNAIYIMTFSSLWQNIIEMLYSENGIVPSLYVGPMPLILKHGATELSVPFYSLGAARSATPPDLQGFERQPLDCQILEYFSPKMPIIMESVSRFAHGKKAGSYDQRRNLIWEMIRIWQGIFQVIGPDVVVCGSAPHRIFDYITQLLCEHKGIEFRWLEETHFRRSCYFLSSPEKQSDLFSSVIYNEEKTLSLSPFVEKYIATIRKGDYDTYRAAHSLTGMHSLTKINQETLITRLLKQYLPGLIVDYLIVFQIMIRGQYRAPISTMITFPDKEEATQVPARLATAETAVTLQRLARREVMRASKWYEIESQEELPSDPFVYFPASYQPERSTVPDGGYFFDYYLIISMLDRALPKTWKICYKEHPRTFKAPIARDNPRDVDFYLRLKRASKRLVFISTNIASTTLIESCVCVATPRGTAGWEALASSKPVFCFGSVWYDMCPGVFRTDELSALQNAVTTITENYSFPSRAFRQYISEVERKCEDLEYYFQDNVYERSGHHEVMPRMFTKAEQDFRIEFTRKMKEALIRVI